MIHPNWNDLYTVLAAFLAGSLLGLEREFHSKPAGFRTWILITVGSALFTMLSVGMSTSGDRIASNIVTGVGFIGGGVIFKEGLNARGITSASAIWLAAAIGMAIGFQHFELAFIVTTLALLVLIFLTRIQKRVHRWNEEKFYKVSFVRDVDAKESIEGFCTRKHIAFERVKLLKDNSGITVIYKIEAGHSRHRQLEASRDRLSNTGKCQN